jgi:hypothetical protein
VDQIDSLFAEAAEIQATTLARYCGANATGVAKGLVECR